MRVDDTHSLDLGSGGQFETVIPSGNEVMDLVVPLAGSHSSCEVDDFTSMVAKPTEFIRPSVVKGADCVSVSLFIDNPHPGQNIAVGSLIARGVQAPLAGWSFSEACPLVDEYGQYTHREWPGKIHTEKDLVAHREQEANDLAHHSLPKDWDGFGGWQKGPQLEATGYFRVEKVKGVWWMVDPEGRLFWSHGVVRVGTRIPVGGIYRGTPLLDREKFFNLPGTNSALARFYGTEPQATRGYYVGRSDHAVYDYLEANLFHKYGSDWDFKNAETAQRRLGSWGLNTIATSSDPKAYSMRETPYTAVVYTAPFGAEEYRIAGSHGDWGKFPDPFDPEWRRQIVKNPSEKS